MEFIGSLGTPREKDRWETEETGRFILSEVINIQLEGP